MAGKSLSALLPAIDWAAILASVMLSFKKYEKEALSEALAEEVRHFLQDEFTLEEIGHICPRPPGTIMRLMVL